MKRSSQFFPQPFLEVAERTGMGFLGFRGLLHPTGLSILQEVRDGAAAARRFSTFMGNVDDPAAVVAGRERSVKVMRTPTEVLVGSGDEGSVTSRFSGLDTGRQREIADVMRLYRTARQAYSGLPVFSSTNMSFEGFAGGTSALTVELVRVQLPAPPDLVIVTGALEALGTAVEGFLATDADLFEQGKGDRLARRRSYEELADREKVALDLLVARRLREEPLETALPKLEAFEWSISDLMAVVVHFEIRPLIPDLLESLLSPPPSGEIGVTGAEPFLAARLREEFDKSHLGGKLIEALQRMGPEGLPHLKRIAGFVRQAWSMWREGAGEDWGDFNLFPLPDLCRAMAALGERDEVSSLLQDLLYQQSEIDAAGSMEDVESEGLLDVLGRSREDLWSHNLCSAAMMVGLGALDLASAVYQQALAHEVNIVSDQWVRLPFVGTTGLERKRAGEILDHARVVFDPATPVETLGDASQILTEVELALSALEGASESHHPEDRRTVLQICQPFFASLSLAKPPVVSKALSEGHLLQLARSYLRVAPPERRCEIVDLLERWVESFQRSNRFVPALEGIELALETDSQAFSKNLTQWIRTILDASSSALRLEAARLIAKFPVNPLLRDRAVSTLKGLLALQRYEVSHEDLVHIGLKRRHAQDAQEIRVEAARLLDSLEPGWDSSLKGFLSAS